MGLAQAKYATKVAFNGHGLSVDHGAYMGRHDIVYLQPPTLPGDAQFVGDGDLAASVWCPDGQIMLQINKTDIWSTETPPRQGYPEDWQLHSACRIRLVSDPSPFEETREFEQRLSLYGAQVQLHSEAPQGNTDVTVWVPSSGQVVCVQFKDTMLRNTPRRVELEPLRNAQPFAVNEYIGALEQLPDRRVAVVCRSLSPRHSIGWADRRTPQLQFESPRGVSYTLFIAVGITDRNGDPVKVAKARLEGAMRMGVEQLGVHHRLYWRNFWQKSFLHLSSPEEDADYFEHLWYLYLYQMGSAGRAFYPQISRGGLWMAGDAQREGGAAMRHREVTALYRPTFAANHLELTSPWFDTLQRMLGIVQRDTNAREGLEGARYPSATTQNGDTVEIPDLSDDPGEAAVGLEMAALYWWCWLHTMDRDFLRYRTYPMLRMTAAYWEARLTRSTQDGTGDFDRMIAHPRIAAALSTVLEALLVCVDELMEEEAPAELWRDMLAKIGTSLIPDPDSLDIRITAGDALSAVYPMGLVHTGHRDYTPAIRLFDRLRTECTGTPGSPAGVLAARLGMKSAIPEILDQQIQLFQTLQQGFLTNGTPGTATPRLDALAEFANALQEMCLQSHDGVLRIFPAVPKEWNGSFMLRAFGGFNVMAEQIDGRVLWVAVQSLTGERCRLANPWPDTARVQDGKIDLLRSAEPVLQFDTERGRVYVIDRLLNPLSRIPRERLGGRRRSGIARLGERRIGIPAPRKKIQI